MVEPKHSPAHTYGGMQVMRPLRAAYLQDFGATALLTKA